MADGQNQDGGNEDAAPVPVPEELVGEMGALASKSASVPEDVDEPEDRWQGMLLVAGFRMLGRSWKRCAELAGVHEATVHRWRRRDSWGQAVEEAADEWFTEMDLEARRTMLEAVRDGDRVAAQKYLERTDERMAPQQQQQEQSQGVQVIVHPTGADQVGDQDGGPTVVKEVGAESGSSD